MELLIDFNGNKFAARETVNDKRSWKEAKFNDRILTLNGRELKEKETQGEGMRALKLCSAVFKVVSVPFLLFNRTDKLCKENCFCHSAGRSAPGVCLLIRNYRLSARA